MLRCRNAIDDEPTYILDITLLEHKLADHYVRVQDLAVKGTAHELYSVLVGTIEVMIGLKGTGHRFYLETMKLFDASLVLFILFNIIRQTFQSSIRSHRPSSRLSQNQ